jgi:hypothetical protein
MCEDDASKFAGEEIRQSCLIINDSGGPVAGLLQSPIQAVETAPTTTQSVPPHTACKPFRIREASLSEAVNGQCDRRGVSREFTGGLTWITYHPRSGHIRLSSAADFFAHFHQAHEPEIRAWLARGEKQ